MISRKNPGMSVSLKNLPDLLLDTEVDELFRLPTGQSKRLAKKGLIKAIVLPGGKHVRFTRETVERMLTGQTAELFPRMRIASGGGR
jgi:hypothetical protein